MSGERMAAVDHYLARLADLRDVSSSEFAQSFGRTVPNVDEGTCYGLPAFKYGASGAAVRSKAADTG